MSEEEKTQKEKRVPEKTDPSGMDTQQGLAGLEISQVEILEKTVAGKKPIGDTPTRPENRPTPDVQTRVQRSDVQSAPPESPLKNLSYGAKKQWSFLRSWTLDAWTHHLRPLLTSSQKASPSVTEILDHFGPTILVCFMFFFWVIYDRTVRPRPSLDEIRSNQMVLGAMKELSKGNRKQAENMLLSASKLTRDREKLERLREILAELE